MAARSIWKIFPFFKSFRVKRHYITKLFPTVVEQELTLEFFDTFYGRWSQPPQPPPPPPLQNNLLFLRPLLFTPQNFQKCETMHGEKKKTFCDKWLFLKKEQC